MNAKYSLTNKAQKGNNPDGKSQGARVQVIFPKEYCLSLPASLEGMMCFIP